MIGETTRDGTFADGRRIDTEIGTVIAIGDTAETEAAIEIMAETEIVIIAETTGTETATVVTVATEEIATATGTNQRRRKKSPRRL